MAFSKTLTVLTVAAVAAAKSAMVLHDSLATVPAGFVSHGPAPATHELELRFGLAGNDVKGLQAKLMEVSTPGSANFRQWLSKEEVKTYMAPSSATLSAFNSFASAHGLNTTKVSPYGEWITATVPVAKANEMFDANFELFSHPDLDGKIARTMSVSLPSEMVGVVNVVHPSTAFAPPPFKNAPSLIQIPVPKLKRGIAASCNTSEPNGVTTPACLQAVHGIPATPATQANNSLLVTGYVTQHAQKADLQAFLEQLRPDMHSSTGFSLESVDGGDNPQGPDLAGFEASLDIQYTVGVATGVPTIFLSNGNDTDIFGAFIHTATYLQGVSNPPSVMTTSYTLDEPTVDPAVANAICDAYMALAARGVSVIFAAGDGGVHGGHDDSSVCDNEALTPAFPSTCPFLTAVGSTFGIPERAANFSSGGFSNIFPAPAYQTAQIASFLKTVPSDFNAMFNLTGRGFPDVSTQGWNFQIINNGITTLESGTSASAPTFASIIALINDRLIAAGKPVLGFLNPFLYANPGAFNDVTAGHNSGAVCPESGVGFDATTGWDPLTGLGTPNFTSLLAAAMA
ncbi:unnamed protein product [Mycena citricolor]|uniref:tripeptidyl-peptidase II n=1 Tax=Mycena citricolor TaxID=2018698 RepID=A0AAD2HU21_9AGAR|nr:unnamed protein product [Mycena citricolor]CAK5281060.1 unnamed protein product [Mycena citricolor]